MSWSDLTSGLGSALGETGGALKDAGVFSFDIDTDFMDGIFDEVSDLFSDSGIFTSGAKELGGGVVDMFGNAEGGMLDGISSTASAVKDTSADIIQNQGKEAVDPLKDMMGWAKSPGGKNALAMGVLALYKKRRQDELLKKQHEHEIERDTLRRKRVGAFYVGG